MTSAVVGLGMMPLAGVAPATADTAGELFFSEYVEGSSNNKALEIYNGTGAAVDLADYSVQMYFNGSPTAGLTILLTGNLPPGDAFVVAHSAANAEILGQADLTNGGGWYNGDDAVALTHEGSRIDVIGQVGVDPGSQWGTGDASTADNTLRRKSTVTAGDPDGTDAFDPSAEWEGYPQDTFDGLGTHEAGPAPDVPPTVASTTPTDGQKWVPQDASITVVFSEPVTLADDAITLACAGADVALTVTGGPTDFTVDPTDALPAASTCTLTVHAAGVTDQDGDQSDPMAADYVTSFTVVEAGPVCEHSFTPIYEIQGSGAESPLVGQEVSTEGVVVGDVQDGLNGYYIQDRKGDHNRRTSDGVFVYAPGSDEVKAGDLVHVAGTVSEFKGLTELSAADTEFAVCAAGGVVDPERVRLPFRSEAQQERYEGMLVTLPQTLSVTEHFQLGRFGEVLLSSHGRLHQPTNVVKPGKHANKLQAKNDLNQIVVDDSSDDQNPDPIPFSRSGKELSAENTLRAGDTATGIVGVMTFAHDSYRVLPLGALGGSIDFEAANPRPAEPEDVGGDLKVASFNVLNYFNTFNDRRTPGDDCTGGVSGAAMDCRGADNAFEFERQADKIVAAIAGLDADVVGLIEIENDGYGQDSAIQDLVTRLNEKVGAGSYAFIDVDAQTHEVDALGDDAIKVGMLYRPDVVNPLETAVLNTESFVNGENGDPKNRPALAQTFEQQDGARVTVVVNHFKSKGSDCDPVDPDTGDGQGNCNLTRTQAAEELAAWLATDPTRADDSDVLIMGDLNSYAQEDPIEALEDAGYTDLVRKYEGRDAYSYVFDGQWGYLDHALASKSLKRQVTGVTTWHINADEPIVLDYNTDFKSGSQVDTLYAPTPYRSSDHDPVLVGLDLRR